MIRHFLNWPFLDERRERECMPFWYVRTCVCNPDYYTIGIASAEWLLASGSSSIVALWNRSFLLNISLMAERKFTCVFCARVEAVLYRLRFYSRSRETCLTGAVQLYRQIIGKINKEGGSALRMDSRAKKKKKNTKVSIQQVNNFFFHFHFCFSFRLFCIIPGRYLLRWGIPHPFSNDPYTVIARLHHWTSNPTGEMEPVLFLFHRGHF